MSETKSGGKTVGGSENFRYHIKNFAMFAKFLLCVITKFFFNKIN